MKYLNAKIYIPSNVFSQEIERLIHQAAMAGIKVKQEKDLKFVCIFNNYSLDLTINQYGSFSEILVIPKKPFNMKNDEFGHSGLDLAFYVRCLIKIIKGYELVELNTIENE